MSIQIVKDHLGNQLNIPLNPKRIICLVPSLTELLFDLGLADRIVGVTKFCIHPHRFKNTKQIVGGTKNFRFDEIQKLNPDLIIANKEENYQEGVEKLQKTGLNVWISDIFNFEDALRTISDIGAITNKMAGAEELSNEIKSEFLTLTKLEKKKVAYLIWDNPKMTVGKNTFINDILNIAGYNNVFNSLERYPEISDEDIIDAKPDYILLSSEPYPFKDQHLSHFKNRFPFAKALLVDGEMFSWYGSRMKLVPDYLNSLEI